MKFVEDKMLVASQLPKRTIALVLAGGRGTRLHQLTDNRAKPAVYFGGKFRIIDFALSNCINSGIRRVGVITQYRPHSLIRHLQRGWSFLRGEQNEFIDLMPAGQQMEEGLWYRGTADAVAQNKGILRSYEPEYILILAGDHIYKMDYSMVLLDHVERKSPCTVACIEVPRMDATGFGVMDVDDNRKITRFLEKPADPPGIPGNPDKALASMGSHIDRMVELTGTPSPNGLDDLWAQIFLLDGGERLGKRYTQFRERYFQPDKRGADGMVYSYEAKPGTDRAILDRISDICISMKAEDYLQLPDITYHEVPVVLDPKALKAYQELEREMVLQIPEDEEEISVTSAAALSNKLLQLANGALYDEDRQVHEIHNCKIEAFLELIESLQGKPALVFYNYQHDRERILKALEGSKLRIRELKTPRDEDDWNNREIDILLTHPASSAYGLNLQQGGNHVIWFGLTWNYELYTQANKRLHRQGQQEKVIIHHLVCRGTRDEDVMYALEQKDNVQNWVMESLKARIRAIKEGKV